MGDISEMMLDGTLCMGCGVFLEDMNADGFPRYCSAECDPKPRKKKTAAQRKHRARNRCRSRARKRVAKAEQEKG